MTTSIDENNNIRLIINIIDYIKKHDLFHIKLQYGTNICNSIFEDNKLFANALFKEVDLQFIPLFIETNIGFKYFNISGRKFAHYIEFIKNNQ